MDQVTKLKLEIAAKKAFIEDLRTAIELHQKHGELEAVTVCKWRIVAIQRAITRLEAQLLDNQNFGRVLQNFRGGIR